MDLWPTVKQEKIIGFCPYTAMLWSCGGTSGILRLSYAIIARTGAEINKEILI